MSEEVVQQQIEIKLSRSTVRNWQPGDLVSLVEHANNRQVSINLRNRFPYPYTAADGEAWINIANSGSFITNFAIVVDGVAVGGIGFELKDDVEYRSAEIGYWLGESYWRRGIASEALQAVTEYAFANFDLCRIYAGVYDWNPNSAKVLEKAGYQFEGRHRKAITKDGRTGDKLVYAIVR